MSDSTQMVKPGGGAISPRQAVHKYLNDRLPMLTQWASNRLDPASLVRFAMVEWQQSPQLQACSMESIYLALIACAQVGLEPSGIKQEAFIVPYRGVATFMPGWRGLIKLARRSREVRAVRAHLVHERDFFEPEYGSDERVVHRPVLGDRGALIGAYALAKMDNGEIEVELMSLDELRKIRDRAKRGDKESPAYRDWEDQMYRKAPIRRLCKRLPLGDDYFRAARMDEALEGNDLRAYQQAIDPEHPGLMPQAEEAPATATRGMAGAKEQLASRRRRAEPTESTPDDLAREVAAIEDSLGHKLLANPQWVPGLRERIGKLPEPERTRLQQMLIEGEQELESARRQDDLPDLAP